MSDHIQPGRLTLTAAVPALLLSLLIAASLFIAYDTNISEQQQLYGQATVEQLSEQFATHLVDEDILSINVLAKRSAKTGQLAFIAIYDAGNNLLAQSGRESAGVRSFTREITFQDSLVGSIRIVLTEVPGISPLLVVLWLLAAGLLLGLVYIFGPGLLSPAAAPQVQAADAEPVLLVTDGPVEECILVVRIRPARHLAKHFNRFFEAARLYQGIVEQTTPEELVIHFEGPDASYMAACTGLLIRQLAGRIGGNISFGGTLNLIGDEPEKIRKAASYLASIAEGELLLAGTIESLGNRADLQSFHHSLVDSRDVKRVASVISQRMLDDQAMELSAS